MSAIDRLLERVDELRNVNKSLRNVFDSLEIGKVDRGTVASFESALSFLREAFRNLSNAREISVELFPDLASRLDPVFTHASETFRDLSDLMRDLISILKSLLATSKVQSVRGLPEDVSLQIKSRADISIAEAHDKLSKIKDKLDVFLDSSERIAAILEGRALKERMVAEIEERKTRELRLRLLEMERIIKRLNERIRELEEENRKLRETLEAR